jgi:pimeloyl-ACP methyl ester carboxylesterase
MQHVTSHDGTAIAYETTGNGPTLILVDGAMCSRGFGPMGELAALLAPRFTVFTYDRRGRGDSGDTPPYAVAREVEDIAALITAAGGRANIFGTSSGAALTLEAAHQLPGQFTKLAIYEAPYSPEDNPFRPPADYVPHLTELIAAGRRGDAVDYFMGVVGTPSEAIAQMHQSPVWPMFEAVAPTLVYDGIIMNGFAVPTEGIATITVPALVMAGGASPAPMQQAAQTVAETLPHAQFRLLPDQTHQVAAEAIVPVLAEFFAD